MSHDPPHVPRTTSAVGNVAVASGFVATITLALAAGGSLGFVSFASDYYLRQPWSALGNLLGPWVLVAFVVGALSSGHSVWRGVGMGFLALVVATLTYYALTSLMWPSSSAGRLVFGVLVWGALAALVGPAAGGAGAVWRLGDRSRRGWWLRAGAVSGLATILVGEAVFLRVATVDADWAVTAAEIVVGALLPVFLLRSTRERTAAWIGIAVLSVAAVPLMLAIVPAVFRLAGSGW